jgi:tyrosinase
MDDLGLANLKGKIDQSTWDKLAKVKGNVYLSGNRLYVAAGIQYQGTGSNGVPSQDDRIMAELQRINPLWHQQRWAGMNAGLISHYPTPDDIQRILQTPDFAHWGGGPSSDHFFGAVESVHNYMHNFSGGLNPNFIIGQNPEFYVEPQYGHMVEARVTAFDPIFWGHHSNVDRLWAQWQGLHPGVNPQELNSPLAPFEMTVADTINYKDLGYEYMQDAHYFPTDNQVGMVRFRSEPVSVSTRVQQNHSKVEVRLHGVQLTERGANIRVFLNQPEATAETSIERNDNYVGNFLSFVGFCYGGPGHCEVPSSKRRPFDHRMRHHKTPGNLRFDATETVQKLLAAQKDQSTPLPLSVHLVVTDIQGQTRDDLLKLDGVSVNFIQ